MRTFRAGLLVGLSIAVAVGAVAIAYERYDTKDPEADDPAGRSPVWRQHRTARILKS